MQLVVVDDFYFFTLYGNELFIGKGRERAYGIAGGHVGDAGKVFTAELYAQGASVLLCAVSVFEIEKRFCQPASDVFLGEADNALVRSSQLF